MSYEWRTRADDVLRWLRACAVCRSVRPPVDLLCQSCWEGVGPRLNDGPALLQDGYELPVYALSTWTPSHDEWIKPLLYSFKGGRNVRAATHFAGLLTNARGITKDAGSIVFVHPPSSTRLGDHAWLLAEAAARIWECRTLALEPAAGADRRSQKRQSVANRALMRFEPVPRARISGRPRTYVFIDDVVTTGATAKAAFQALDGPKDFEVWALASRPKLAAAEDL